MNKADRQGGVETAWIWKQLMEAALAPVVIRWEEKGWGVKMNNETLRILLFAENVFLFAECASQLKEIWLDTTNAMMWFFHFLEQRSL